MDQLALDFEDRFEEHSVSSQTVASSLDIDYVMCRQHGILGAPPTATTGG